MYILVHIMYTRLYSGESVSTHVYMHGSLYMFNAYSAYIYTVHIVHIQCTGEALFVIGLKSSHISLLEQLCGALSHYKHIHGGFFVVESETLKRATTPLFGRLV